MGTDFDLRPAAWQLTRRLGIATYLCKAEAPSAKILGLPRDIQKFPSPEVQADHYKDTRYHRRRRVRQM